MFTEPAETRNALKIPFFPLVALDVRNTESIQKAVSEVIEKSGRLDIVINNAGVGITGPLEEIPSEEIKNNFETNLFGPIEVMKAVLPQMRTQKSGLIINITSIAGYNGTTVPKCVFRIKRGFGTNYGSLAQWKPNRSEFI